MKGVTRAYYFKAKLTAEYTGLPCLTVLHFIASQILFSHQHPGKNFHLQKDDDSLKVQIMVSAF